MNYKTTIDKLEDLRDSIEVATNEAHDIIYELLYQKGGVYKLKNPYRMYSKGITTIHSAFIIHPASVANVRFMVTIETSKHTVNEIESLALFDLFSLLSFAIHLTDEILGCDPNASLINGVYKLPEDE